MVKGIIYQITQNCDDKKIAYIGSTFRCATVRYKEHQRWARYSLWNSCSCAQLFDNKYDNEPSLKILDEIDFQYDDKVSNGKILRKLEFYYIQNTENLVNKITALGNPQSWYGRNKGYAEAKRKSSIVKCTCGLKINLYYLKKHLTTKKHKLLLEKTDSK